MTINPACQVPVTVGIKVPKCLNEKKTYTCKHVSINLSKLYQR